MREYTVYFIVKKDNHGYLNQQTVQAISQKQAIKLVKEKVYADCGRNAFLCTCKKPVLTEHGMEFNGGIYTRYSELFNRLW